MKLLEKTRKKLRPSEPERARLASLWEKAKTEIASAVLVGSVAKGTNLAGKKELDVFVLFETGTIEAAFREVERTAVRLKPDRIEKAFAQHPYLRLFFGKYRIDLVPAFKMKKNETPRSALDRTPLHAEYVGKNLRNPDEARLLKRFCEVAGVYGADSIHDGFSGYLCELLVIKFKNFLSVLREVQNWDSGAVIEAGEYPAPFALGFADPVDRNRNVAAAVSKKSLLNFKKAASSFLKNPSEKFFFPKEPKFDKINFDKIIAIKFEKGTELDDVFFSKVKRQGHRLFSRLKVFHFTPIRWAPLLGEKSALAVIELKCKSPPKEIIRQGPPTSVDKKFVDAFKEKHDQVFITDGRLFAKIKPKYRLVKEVITAEFPDAKFQDSHALEKLYNSSRDGKLKEALYLFAKKLERWQL